jgi:hypothetical protein
MISVYNAYENTVPNSHIPNTDYSIVTTFILPLETTLPCPQLLQWYLLPGRQSRSFYCERIMTFSDKFCRMPAVNMNLKFLVQSKSKSCQPVYLRPLMLLLISVQKLKVGKLTERQQVDVITLIFFL